MRRFPLFLIFIACIKGHLVSGQSAGKETLDLTLFKISWSSSHVDSWQYTLANGERLRLRLPVFEINGKETPVILQYLRAAGAVQALPNGVKEYLYEGPFEANAGLRFQMKIRAAADNPIVRFSYSLKAGNAILSQKTGKNQLTYLSASLQDFSKVKEVRLAVFNEMIHSCNLSEVPVTRADFENGGSAAGPVLVAANGKSCFLLAYEHDSMYPNRFLEYRFGEDSTASLTAVKGNYYEGQQADGYSTIWLEAGGVAGDEEKLAADYRRFMAQYISQNMESRKPYIYYNTWGRQERDKWAGGQYLSNMNLEYTLKEIDRASDMGIEVYVIDAGWFDKTGDWGIHPKNFPDGFRQIRRKAEGYGMKLGVWMDPEKAAVSSRALQQNKKYLKTSNGKHGQPSPVWETEESVDMCPVSPYWEYYAAELIRLYKETGIHYFYLDGVGQTGCDDPGHFHGTSSNTREERQQSYGFLIPVFLGKIIEKVSAACPAVIFDFDVTEAGRIGAGLQFLASGRYFILNNGPYYHNFDLTKKGSSLLPNGNRNIFVQPGPARTWFMRSVLDYDKWIPSNLFLANYQPDDPGSSQIINLASLVLGQNSIWGDILKTSPEGVGRFAKILSKYKEVRDDIAKADPVRVGRPGDTPEIYEKINPLTGKGVVVIFANAKGQFSYITRGKVNHHSWTNEGATVKKGANGHAQIDVTFEEASAKIIFFGVNNGS
ncbi:hypothetical protein DYBT9275_04384 [Dyadobacter sp. CECT 9275]|uniref:Alpha-galactosidase n=1 Tax=Dyadobacter helix TaxID=2822344 RepID=A0A916N699_9BACT|nr:alpha-galactosidase [Dyadobacter sp. CECT 9275]CAG5008917.1 hypothetical protein DYBT9275_04384 [Dyadobacter sp. CECT 9275]